MEPFKHEYANIYDLLYGGKDYNNEVNIIEQNIKEYKPDSKKVLDYGCGTGNHLNLLTSRGYEVYGLDKNENMLAIAKQKLRENKNVCFYTTNERDFIKPDSVDVCTTLFDVVSYMHTNEEINSFFTYVKKVLVKNGLFIFDFWYGPGIINLVPEKRWKEYSIEEKKILRLTSPLHNKDNCVVTVTHELIITEKDRLVGRFTDIHNMRYFFKNEIQLLLEFHGFEILKFGTWENPDILPAINDWTALVVCKSVK